MSSNVNLKASGLVISPNQLELPEGSLVEASNVIIRRDNVIEKRRGFKLYENAFGASTDRAKQLFTYQNQIIRHFSDVLQYDTASGAFANFAGSYLETQTGLRIKSVAANNNCYFTTSDGIKKISSSSSDLSATTIVNAGGVKAIDLTAQLKYTYGSSSGFLPINSAVTYQVVWGIKDANQNLILGTPSSSFQIYNFGEQLIAQDLAKLLTNLDGVGNNAGSGLLSETDYLNTLKLPITATASQLRSNLISLASKIDNDILYADQATAPLVISSAVITNGICTVTFSSGTVTDYLEVGNKIYLSGFTLGNSVKTFDSTADVSLANDRITISNHGYISGDIIVFSGTLPGNVVAGITYYIINPTTNDFQIAVIPNGSAVDINATAVGIGTATVNTRGNAVNKDQIVTDVTSTTLSFLTTGFGDISLSTAKINSNAYRTLTQPEEPSVIVTGAQVLSIQTYMDEIIAQLQSENSFVISTNNLNTYIIPLSVTTTSTVLLNINIPQDVINAGLNQYFYQVYRSPISEATQTTALVDLVPSSELKLVYESFPTQDELTAREISLEDVVPDSFAGAFLYTNEATGEGALQANDVPPFAKDINYFKNVVFYANTKTRQRKTFSILGISEIINQYDLGNNPSITITNGTVTTTYKFIKGVKEITQFLFGAIGVPAVNTMVSAAAPASYFTINDGNNENSFYVWYQNGSNPTDPAVASKTGIKVSINTTDTNDIVIAKTRDALNELINSFNSYLYFKTFEQNSSNIDIATDTFNNTAHGFINDEPVKFSSSLTLPSPLTSSTLYYIVNAAANTFQVSLTVGGAVVDITTVGTGNITVTNQRKLIVENVNAGITTDANISTLPSPYSLSITQQGNGEDATTNSVLLSDLVSPAQALDETSRSLVSVINKNATSPVYAYYLSGVGSVPGKMLLESVALSNSPFYILASSSTFGSSFNPDVSPSNSITNISVANPTIVTSTAHGLVNGDQIVIAGTNSTPSINGIYTITVTGANTFSIPVNVTVLGTTGGFSKKSFAENSSNEDKIHRVYYSKKDQPEAVPLLNYFDVGASDKAILRVFPLRDSLFVFKEDGLYRISGESAPFSLALFDSSCILTAPDSLGVSNNLIYSWTKQGIATISESGANTVSRAIDTEILKVGSNNYPNFSKVTFGIGYESDNSYLVWTAKNQTDTVANICYRFSNLTNTWTTYDKTNTCGILKGGDDVLYLGAGDTNFIEQERKTFSRLDYADREIIKTLNNDRYFGNKIILSNINDISIGDVFLQDQTLSTYTFNMLLKKLDLDPGVPSTDYYSTLKAMGGSNLRTSLVSLCTKLDSDSLFFTDYASRIGQKSGSVTSITAASSAIITSASHGLLTGRIITISGNTSTPSINSTYAVTVIDSNTFTIPTSVTTAVAGGTWITPIASFSDLKACYNLTIDHLNADTTVSYTNYTLITDNTIQESIVKSINTVTKEVTLNLTLDYVVGDITIYKSINSIFTYAPTTLGDPLNWKHMYEATMMFESKAFTSATLSFSTDLLPQFIDVNFDADSNGIFGHQAFGTGFFGGASHAAPFRTYIPRNAQRCRFINVKFGHNVARENVLCFGMTLTSSDNSKSTRAYRG